MGSEKQIDDLKTENSKLKRGQTELLAYSDMDSLVSCIDTYLVIMRSVGDKKASGECLFETGIIKKIAKSLRAIHAEYCDFDGSKNWESWKQNDRQLKHEKLKCLVNQQLAIINTATVIWCEEYKKCSDKKIQMLYGVEIMMEDVKKAVGFLPSA